MEERTRKTLKALKARNMRAWSVADAEEARDLIMNLIPNHATVCVGDSSSVRQVGITKELELRGNKVINAFDPEMLARHAANQLEVMFRLTIEASLGDVFLTGANAVTEDGRILNVDAAGNRVAGMIWGHPQVILVVGKNKVVRDLDEAFDRVKNVIAPEHIRRRGSFKTPCGVTGKCEDCTGRNRVCNVTAIIEGAPLFSEINVVLVNKDLGLGWDPCWSRERIAKIGDHHEKFMCGVPEEAFVGTTKESLWKSVKPFMKSKGQDVD
jgi:hypothetical protein